MAGIAPRMGHSRLRWAYALAGLLIVLGVGTGILLRPHPSPSGSIMMAKAQAVHRAEQQPKAVRMPTYAPKEVVVANAPKRPHRALQKKTLIAAGAIHQAKPERALPQQPVAAQPKPSAPVATAQAPPSIDLDKKPVALVMVTFPSGETTTDKSYEYTDRNVETGEVTECSVNRTGDLMDIHLETTKGDEPKLPVKGCVDYGKKINA
jgi:hypothetical protein